MKKAFYNALPLIFIATLLCFAQGATVTTTGVQTLTHKTLTSTVSGNSVTLLNNQAQTSAQTGDATDKVLYTYTVAANQVQAGKGLRACAWSSHSSGSASVTYKLTLGSTTFHSHASSTGSNAQNAYCTDIMTNGAVQNSEVSHLYLLLNGNTVSNVGVVAGSENFANSLVLKFTFNVAATDQVTGQGFYVEAIQ